MYIRESGSSVLEWGQYSWGQDNFICVTLHCEWCTWRCVVHSLNDSFVWGRIGWGHKWELVHMELIRPCLNWVSVRQSGSSKMISGFLFCVIYHCGGEFTLFTRISWGLNEIMHEKMLWNSTAIYNLQYCLLLNSILWICIEKPTQCCLGVIMT